MSARLRAISQPVVSHVAKRSEPELRAVMRPEKSWGGDSDEILKTVLQTISRQNENRSRSLIVSVDQKSMTISVRAANAGCSVVPRFAL